MLRPPKKNIETAPPPDDEHEEDLQGPEDQDDADDDQDEDEDEAIDQLLHAVDDLERGIKIIDPIFSPENNNALIRLQMARRSEIQYLRNQLANANGLMKSAVGDIKAARKVLLRSIKEKRR